jgi:lipid-binding SYLF domain-containing protein
MTRHLAKFVPIFAIAAFMLWFMPVAAHAQTEQQTLVDRATLSVQDLLGDKNANDARNLMKRAKGVMVCPQIFKAGFIFGGQGGGCVMAGRGPSGWTGPAFYFMGSGSVGLQIGIQDAQIIFIVLTEKGLQALLDSQFKIGGDATIAFATLGVGIQGSTTAALNADIVAFAQARGLFAGLSVDGSLISNRSDWNQAYYGRPIAAQQIVLSNEGNNPGADPLREMLGRFSGG